MVVILLIAGLKLVYGIDNFLGICLWDESSYLYNGVTLLDSGFPTADWAPFYALWYYLLSLFQPDRVQLYYLNYKILLTVLPVFVYVLLRRYKLPILGSVIVAELILISHVNIFGDPRISHFAVLISLLFFFIVTYLTTFTSVTLVLAIGALLLSYVRPAFFLTYLLLTSLYFGVLIARFKEFRLSREALPFLVFMVVSLSLLISLGQPAFSEKGGRSWEAFSQHFSLNWVHWTNSDKSPWSDGNIIIPETFDDAQSISEALINNPLLFIKHGLYNLSGFFKEFGRVILLRFNILLPNKKGFWKVEPLLLLGILATYIFYTKRRLLHEVKAKFQTHRGLLLHFALYSLPGIISAVIIFPRRHYLFLISILFAIVIAIFIAKTTDQQEYLGYKRVLIIGVIIISMTPCISDYYSRGMPGFAIALDNNMRVIKFIKDLEITDEVNLLEIDGGYHTYLGDNFHWVKPYAKNTSFFEFMSERDINIIVLKSTLIKDTRFKDDSEWHYFLSNCQKYRFTKMNVPNAEGKLLVLLVKNDLLSGK